MKAALLVLLPVALTACTGEAPPPAVLYPSTPSVRQAAPPPSVLPASPVAAKDDGSLAKGDGSLAKDDGRGAKDDGPRPCPKVVPPAAPTPTAAALPVTPSPAPVPTPSAEVNGASAAPPPKVVMPFDAGHMERPKRLSGEMPDYSREARRACAQGTLIARCVITTTGALTDCQIIKSIPTLDGAMLKALATWQMTPVVFQGRPVATLYTIPFKFQLQ